MPGAVDLHRTLSETAASYLALGWSVVPLWADSRPEQAKVPAVAWAPYQRRRASEQDVVRWFTGTPYRGLGIVTGTLSQLVVLDFDDPTLAERFAILYPELAVTRTVRTRRGLHLYFRVPAYLRLPTRKLAGADLLSDGCYVVAPPTVIDGHTYTVKRGGLPKLLTPNDLTALNAFLDRYAAEAIRTVLHSAKCVSKADTAAHTPKTQEAAFTAQDAASSTFLSADGLVTLYRDTARTMHRNSALFKVACLARDHGWKAEAVLAVLANVHAAQLARNQHRPETAKARRREAERTVRSAFSKPPRPPQPQDKEGLFNSIREKLLQLGQTCVVRVLEGLRLAGIKAGRVITEQTLRQLLKGIVGEYSIRKTLAATAPDGTLIFERRPPHRSPRCAAAKHIRIARQKTAYVNETEPQLNRGRPQTHYRIPTPEALCKALGVAPSGSDPVTLDDLKTAKTTRQALQRGLIARRPGLYLRKWLADRLGVSERTLSRYNYATPGLKVTPTFVQTPLGWGSLNAIPRPDAAPPGTCLEDSTGKRWPAIKGIAQKLLAQGRGVRLLVRSMNYYWAGTGDPPAPDLQIERTMDRAPVPDTAEPIVTFAQRIERLVRTIGGPTASVPPVQAEAIRVPAKEPLNARELHYANAKARKKRRHYSKPLVDAALEAAAVRLVDVINAMTPMPDANVSLATTRRWTDEYGQEKIEAVLNVLATRPNIQNPAGFMWTLLRSHRMQ